MGRRPNELNEVHLEGITAATRLYCVLGHPVAHSLSPAMQNAALQAMGLEGVYLAFDVRPAGLAEAIRGLRAVGAGGANCTIPHKVAVLPLLDELSEEAALIGAVNTVEFREGRTMGHNTDAPGFLAALRAAGAEPAGRRVLVLGAGGSARAVVAALVRAGARVAVANRTVDRARELARDMGRRLGGEEIRALPLEPECLGPEAARSEILVNTTSAGMFPRTEEAPPVPPDALGPDLFVYDLIYNPLETRLLQRARERGARGAHGVGMLAHQGALALQVWTGRQAPVEKMEGAILAALRGRHEGAAPV